MKIFIIVFALMLGIFGCAEKSPLVQNTVELPLPNSNKIVVKLMFLNGSIADPAGKEGLTYMTANLLTQGGTKDMSYNDIQDALYPMAAGYYATVDKEVTVFNFSFHQDFAEQFYPILRDVILKPAFDESDFNRVKLNQQNYVDQVIRASSDEEYSKKALEDLLFRGTNYQHKIQGKSKSVESMTLEDVKKHYAGFFTQNNLWIGIAGNYSDKFLSRLQSDMQQLPAVKPQIPAPGKARQPNGIEVEIIAKDNAFGSAIFTGFPLSLTRRDDEFAALMVANSYLGEHRKSYSKLYQEIRQKRSMNYGDYSYIEWYDNGGGNMLPASGVPRSSNYFSIWIRPVQIAKQLKQQYKELSNVTIGHAHFAIRMAMYELGKLVTDGLSNEDFEATREFLRSYSKLYIQTPAKQLGFLMDSKFYGRQNYIKELDGLLAKLTADDVNRAIKKYWQTENMFITIITDKSEAEPLAKSLKENLTSPMSYSDLVKSGLPKDILEKDKAVQDLKLNVTSVKIVNSADTFK
jgi:zinc protease